MSLSDRYDERLLGELAALADGSLDGPRRAELEAQVARDPELAAALAEQQRAVTLIRGAAAEVEIPPALRERSRAPSRSARAGARPRSRVGWQPGVALAAAAALLLALVVALTGGPTVEDAAAFAALPPTGRRRPARTARACMASQDGVAFPRWDSEKLGWRATGMHTGRRGRAPGDDRLLREGRSHARLHDRRRRRARRARTRRRSLTAAGTTVELFDAGAGRAATWERDGHTCVLTGRGVPDAVLARLAGWKASDAA